MTDKTANYEGKTTELRSWLTTLQVPEQVESQFLDKLKKAPDQTTVKCKQTSSGGQCIRDDGSVGVTKHIHCVYFDENGRVIDVSDEDWCGT